jgi:hypothetical protein
MTAAAAQAVNDLVVEMQHNRSRADCIAEYRKKLQISERTFDVYWKSAKTEFVAQQDAVISAKLAESIRLEKKALRKEILTKTQALEILAEIAQGKAKKVGEQILIPTYAERTRAIQVISDLEGWKATISIDVTSKGESITVSNLAEFSEIELLEYLEVKNSK